MKGSCLCGAVAYEVTPPASGLLRVALFDGDPGALPHQQVPHRQVGSQP